MKVIGVRLAQSRMRNHRARKPKLTARRYRLKVGVCNGVAPRPARPYCVSPVEAVAANPPGETSALKRYERTAEKLALYETSGPAAVEAMPRKPTARRGTSIIKRGVMKCFVAREASMLRRAIAEIISPYGVVIARRGRSPADASFHKKQRKWRRS